MYLLFTPVEFHTNSKWQCNKICKLHSAGVNIIARKYTSKRTQQHTHIYIYICVYLCPWRVLCGFGCIRTYRISFIYTSSLSSKHPITSPQRPTSTTYTRYPVSAVVYYNNKWKTFISCEKIFNIPDLPEHTYIYFNMTELYFPSNKCWTLYLYGYKGHRLVMHTYIYTWYRQEKEPTNTLNMITFKYNNKTQQQP